MAWQSYAIGIGVAVGVGVLGYLVLDDGGKKGKGKKRKKGKRGKKTPAFPGMTAPGMGPGGGYVYNPQTGTYARALT